MLLEKINSYDADIVINTGDNTTDGLETEYINAGRFLKAIKCRNVISTIGNHDKRNMRSMNFLGNTFVIPKSSLSRNRRGPKRNICF